jgi:hypothetical protein
VMPSITETIARSRWTPGPTPQFSSTPVILITPQRWGFNGR